MQFPCTLGKIQRMIAHTLKVRQRMQILLNGSRLRWIQLVAVEPRDIGRKLVFIGVDDLFLVHDPLKSRFRILIKQFDGFCDIGLSPARHGSNGKTDLLDRQCRILKEAFLQTFEVLPGRCFLFVGFVFDQHINQFFQLADERQQHQDLYRSIDRVDQCDEDHGHFPVHEGESYESIEQIEYDSYDRCPDQLYNKIDPGSTFAVHRGSDRGKQHRRRCTDGNTEDNGK